MNKIKSSENIFSILSPSLLEKKTRRGKNKNICSRGKNESCAEYTPLYPSISYYLWIEILNYVCVCLNWEQGSISTLTLKLNAWHKSSVKKVVNTFLLITFPTTVDALYLLLTYNFNQKIFIVLFWKTNLPKRTMSIPPKNAALPLALWTWKKNLNIKLRNYLLLS